jgi:cytochrome b
LLAGVAAAGFTRHGFGVTHDWLGYFTMMVVFVRLIWGFAGSTYARFSQFIRAPSQVLSYAKSLSSRGRKRYIGHNPLGGYMSFMLWMLVLLVCASGWLYTTDRYWGIEWVETTHRVLTNTLLIFVGLHITGVIVSSWHDRENLVTAMLHGKKRPASDGDIS